jgi:hypothetical protein
MRNNKFNFYFMAIIILLNIYSCRKKVKHEYNYNKLSQTDLNFVPYHVGDVLNLKDQNSGLITQFTCNYWKRDSIISFSGCGKDDNVCIRNSSEDLGIVLKAGTSDSIFNMNFYISPGRFGFEQHKIYLDLTGADYPATYPSNYTNTDGSSSDGQLYLDSLVSNNKVFKKVNCYYGRRQPSVSGFVDSLYFSSTDGVIRLVLPTNNKVFVQ